MNIFCFVKAFFGNDIIIFRYNDLKGKAIVLRVHGRPVLECQAGFKK